jgi:hypothetical protein
VQSTRARHGGRRQEGDRASAPFCGACDIPLLILHDFDKAGFSIFGTLSLDNRRYVFEHDIRVIDVGLRLKDVQACGLEPERVIVSDTRKARRNAQFS